MTYKKLFKETQETLNKYNFSNNYTDILFEDIFNLNKKDYFLNQEKEVNKKQQQKLQRIIKKIIKTEIPLSYLTHQAYFYKLKLYVNKNVLIPRFETEEVVDMALKIIKEKQYNTVLDLGTGSGCIALAIKKEIVKLDVFASDISEKCLYVARKNAYNHDLKINFCQSDLLKKFIKQKKKFDIIISNPPYISDNYSLDKSVLFEPFLALFAGTDGLDIYKRIFADLKLVMNKNGTAIFEIGFDQANSILQLLKDYNLKGIIEKDINNNDRILIVTDLS
ncbi:MAG: peptide chain release factor N(5)-glutamine methyltransferase [Bacillales bacterium]|jgi:release factor glutamine methyltransferase|nr:peptide chain release factor N(5)-glutamine methyltransferase [Bacillales bacterium]